MKKAIIIAAALTTGAVAFAQEASKTAIKWYGFVRTYFAFDTRESNAGTEDLYYYMPNPENLNTEGKDMNEIPSLRYSALTSRLGADLSGEALGYKLGGKIEADFYLLSATNYSDTKTASKVSGTAQFRLRQAYATVSKDGRNWKIGQAWHPMAADLPDIFSLDTGVPFGPFSRTPQLTFDWTFTKGWSLTASALTQQQYTSTGPRGAVADYAKYSCIPEFYVGLNSKMDKGLLRLGADFVTIKPRNFTDDNKNATDRLTTWNLFFYSQQKLGNVDWKTKIVYANDGSHMNMVGGYGVSAIDADGNWTYSATRNLTGWMTFSRKAKDCPWVPQMLLGYSKLFGTPDEIIGGFYKKLNADTVASVWRIQPEILYNLGKLQFGIEYMLTGVDYGRSTNSHKEAQDIYGVMNHRIQAMVKLNF